MGTAGNLFFPSLPSVWRPASTVMTQILYVLVFSWVTPCSVITFALSRTLFSVLGVNSFKPLDSPIKLEVGTTFTASFCKLKKSLSLARCHKNGKRQRFCWLEGMCSSPQHQREGTSYDTWARALEPDALGLKPWSATLYPWKLEQIS